MVARFHLSVLSPPTTPCWRGVVPRDAADRALAVFDAGLFRVVLARITGLLACSDMAQPQGPCSAAGVLARAATSVPVSSTWIGGSLFVVPAATKRTPRSLLPEITFPAPSTVPPIVLDGALLS